MAPGPLTEEQVFGPQPVYGDGAFPTASGEPLTPGQAAYAAANAGFRDPSAPAGSPTEPSYITPNHPATGRGFEVTPEGRLSTPPSAGMSDADVFGASLPGAHPEKPADFGLGFFAGVTKPIDRAAQGLEWLAGKAGLPTDKIDSAVGLPSAAAAAAARAAFVDRQPERPGPIGQFAGNVLAGLALPGGPAVQGAQMGALLSDSTTPVGLAKDSVIGAAGGQIAHSVLGGLGAMIAPKVAPHVSTLLNEGVPLTAGQIVGGALHRIEDGAKSFPIVGDLIGGAQKRSVEGLNRAVANRALAPIGETVPSDVAAGRDAIVYAGDKLSDRYNALIPSLTMAADGQLGSDIRGIGEAAQNLPQEHAKMLGRIIQQNIIEKIDPATGVMPGDALKDAESTLGLQIRRYAKSPMPADQNFADGLTLTRQVLRDWVARSNPQAADELSRLNSGWANLAIGENAASRLGANDGLFTPGQLAGAVRGANDTVRKRGYARGEALMQDLSDAALARLPSTVPDSGSPFRHALEAGVAGLVGKEAGVGPALGKMSTLGAFLSAPYTKIGQPIVQGLLAGSRPDYAPTVAAILQKLQPAASPIGATGALRITGQ